MIETNSIIVRKANMIVSMYIIITFMKRKHDKTESHLDNEIKIIHKTIVIMILVKFLLSDN